VFTEAELASFASDFESRLSRSLVRSLAQARVEAPDNVFIVDDPDPITANKSFLDRVRELLLSMRLTLPPKDQVLKIAGDLYDRYIASINFPQIPDIAEGVFDNMAKRALLFLISQFYDRIAPKPS
jgi:hypothetical protein